MKRILRGAGKNLLVILHVGINNIAKYSLIRIKDNYVRTSADSIKFLLSQEEGEGEARQ